METTELLLLLDKEAAETTELLLLLDEEAAETTELLLLLDEEAAEITELLLLLDEEAAETTDLELLLFFDDADLRYRLFEIDVRLVSFSTTELLLFVLASSPVLAIGSVEDKDFFLDIGRV